MFDYWRRALRVSLSVLLAVVCVVTICPVNAFAKVYDNASRLKTGIIQEGDLISSGSTVYANIKTNFYFGERERVLYVGNTYTFGTAENGYWEIIKSEYKYNPSTSAEAMHFTVEPHEHAFSGAWKSDTSAHWKECTCGVKAETGSHDIVTEPEVEPNCTNTGLTIGERCGTCGYISVAQTELPVNDTHNYSAEPVFRWDENNGCAATFTCGYNSEHTKQMDAEVTPLTKEPTCTEDGYTKFTASVSYNDNEYSAEKTIPGASAKGHSWGEWKKTSEVFQGKQTEERICGSCRATESREIEVIPSSSPVPESVLWINEENFPDEKFRAYISNNFDVNDLGYLTAEQVAAVTKIDCGWTGISTIKGVEHFTSLTELICSYGKETTLDLRANTALSVLELRWWNNLASLDVSANTALTVLSIAGGKLTSLDLSANTELEELYCSSPLTTLNLRANTALTKLELSSGVLSELDLSNNTALKELSCSYNKLSILDVSHNTALETLNCSSNDLTELKLGTNNKLREVSCGDNVLTSLDVRSCPALEKLYCYSNPIEILDVSKNTKLIELHCLSTSITALDLHANTQLKQLFCGFNTLTSLDVSNNTTLTELDCLECAIAELDLSNNTALNLLACEGQCIDLTATYANGRFIVDMASLVGADNLTRISGVVGGSYDAQTGLVMLTVEDDANSATLTYDYDPAFVGDATKRMDVTAIVTLPKPSPTPTPNPNEITLELGNLTGAAVAYVDGVPVTLTSSGNLGTLTLPEGTDAQSIVIYTYNSTNETDPHKQYPTGMYVWLVEKANGSYAARRMEALDNILQYAGSSIRITGKKGIRMITGVPGNAKAFLTGSGLGGYKLLEYGTVVAWDSELKGAALLLETPGAKTAYAYKRGVADPVFQQTNGVVQYTNVLVGFTNDQCIPDLAMRPYILLEDAAGDTITLYGGTVHRSIGYIAYQNRNAFKPGTDAYAYIWSIIRHVYGTAYDAEYKG